MLGHKSVFHLGEKSTHSCLEAVEQHLAVSEEVGKKIPAEDESDALNLDGDETEYRSQETDPETDSEDNPVHEEYNVSNSNRNDCIIHPFNL
ncbi:hypothetical protein AVEN_180077-1 [Araneus ventricosus]|uniref:Uncharacterized protein n=1 Tax=Araneus ventricosus TaxID=182803 RepID=A0A4Y2KJ14_ARAVE|nr:hypothetical protein AVEN_180077-1 [Araneus ventricosus]